jgi:ketosteroid isomerase-like protein
MRGKSLGVLIAFLTLYGCVSLAPTASTANLRQQVMDTERAFAQTMATRNHDAFVYFIADEAVFLSGDTALRGRPQIAAAWKRFYTDKDAPFSWRPEQVEVLDSGNLAISTGPVFDGKGDKLATFTSIWRQESPGVWHIIFDKGDDACR